MTANRAVCCGLFKVFLLRVGDDLHAFLAQFLHAQRHRTVAGTGVDDRLDATLSQGLVAVSVTLP
ncbi:hypothetical protein D3C77_228720 [compost metagenome]